MEKFKTLEEAQAAYDKEIAAHEATKNELEAEKAEHAKTQEIAKEAINKVNITPEAESDKVIATVDKVKFEVLFGVDGLTKEEVAKDAALLKRLVKIGSGAISKLGDK